MTTEAEYKTQNDGSIDYAHYLARGREMRSDEAYSMLRFIGKFLKGLLVSEPKGALGSRRGAVGKEQAAIRISGKRSDPALANCPAPSACALEICQDVPMRT